MMKAVGDCMSKPRDYLDRCHSLAVFGGTFDPIHLGHLAVAEAVLSFFAPQRVLFMPCREPSHKTNTEITSPEHRFQMVSLAVCEHPSFDVSRMELNREGVSYTIDTAQLLVNTCPKGAKIYFIIGADSLDQLLTWKDIDALLTLCCFIAVPRSGYSKKQSAETVRNINAKYGERVFLLDMEKVDISSTEVRRRFALGGNVRKLLPRPVEDYAYAHSLYRGPFSFDEIKNDLQKRLSHKRFYHTLGVIKEAEKLAVHYNADVTKARLAALLHDNAKEYSTEKKKALCLLWGIVLNESETSLIDLTHGHLGAESTKRNYYINDPEIYQAVRYHSTGHGNMTVLDKIIALADFIEPHREFYTPLAQMRELAYSNMDEALRVGIHYTINEEIKATNLVHPASYEALKSLNNGGEK
jgi:nicotinate-nucleotide adenylyltransferase